MALAAAGAQVWLRGAIPALTGLTLAHHRPAAGAARPGAGLCAVAGLRIGTDACGAWPRASPAHRLRAWALLLVLNPYAWLIIVTLFSQFPTPPLTTTLIFTANNLLAFLAWCLAWRVLRQLCAARIRNRTLAALLAGSALMIAAP